MARFDPHERRHRLQQQELMDRLEADYANRSTRSATERQAQLDEAIRQREIDQENVDLRAMYATKSPRRWTIELWVWRVAIAASLAAAVSLLLWRHLR